MKDLTTIAIDYSVLNKLVAGYAYQLAYKRALRMGVVGAGIVGFLMGISGVPVGWYTPFVGLLTFYVVKKIALR
jgi:hypothetical protein